MAFLNNNLHRIGLAMENLQQATENICQLKGELFAMHALLNSMLQTIPMEQLRAMAQAHTQSTETARVVLLNSANIGEGVISAFDHHSENWSSRLGNLAHP
ncbi:hypothetical protein [Achromobacter insuavis]|uniref:hypothetical protein n=1 Tax=Achromobacter insuavis TaxID=1287735 RepID=UPI001F1455A6|nr:hypothetical protein [Achromobacter insuavis]